MAAISAERNLDGLGLATEAKQLYERGEYARAAELWEEAAAAYEKVGDRSGKMESSIDRSTALQALGIYPKACDILLETLELNSPKCLTLIEQTQQLQEEIPLLTVSDNSLTPEQINNLSEENQTFLEVVQDFRNSLKETGNKDVKERLRGLHLLGIILRQEGSLELSLETFNQSLVLAESLDDAEAKTGIFLDLGNTYRAIGSRKLERDNPLEEAAYAMSLERDNNLPPGYNRATDFLLDIYYQKAVEYYLLAANEADFSAVKIQANLNQLSLILDLKQQLTLAIEEGEPVDKRWELVREKMPDFNLVLLEKIELLLPEIFGDISNLPLGRTSLHAEINFAGSLTRLIKLFQIKDASFNREAAVLIADTVNKSRELKNQQAEAYALGILGELYEINGQLDAAEKITQKAREIASRNLLPSSYLWEWQLGRIWKAKGEIKKAIAAYDAAFNTLKSLRADLAATNPDIRFSFQENIEPIYRQFIDLLLQSKPTQTDLKKAIEIAESLQVAELDNFFKDSCSEIEEESLLTIEKLAEIDAGAAIIYPIILPDRLEVMVILPGGILRHYSTAIQKRKLENTIEKLRREAFSDPVSRSLRIQRRGSSQETLGVQDYIEENLTAAIVPLAQQIYEWLLGKAEQDLVANGVKNLVFVLDGDLRNLPMTLLHDGEKFLLETDYNVAVTPALRLTKSLALGSEINVLAAGVSKPVTIDDNFFTPLTSVPIELKENIQPLVPTEVLLDEEFTKNSFQEKLKSDNFNIVHLATHGKFSSNPQETFILTSNGLIKLRELENLLRSRPNRKIELLVLSACQTAEGDNRAVLGLAGVAVKAGAGSTIATLSPVDDTSAAALMGEFYRELSDRPLTGNNKAEALRNAQRTLFNSSTLEYKHPYYWAPFVLVGNWL